MSQEIVRRAEDAVRAREIDGILEPIYRQHRRFYQVALQDWNSRTNEAEQIVEFLSGASDRHARAPVTFDYGRGGLRYRYPNVAAYDFKSELLGSFFDAATSKRIPVPLVMDLHFKAPCGLRCIFCYTEAGVTDERHAIDENKYGQMKEEDLASAIRQYADLGGHTIILLSIGEPLTDVDLFMRLAETAHHSGIRVLTFTNMLNITPAVAQRLRKAEVSLLLKLNHFRPGHQQSTGRP